MIDRVNGYLKTIKEKKLKKYVLKVPYNADNEIIVEKMQAFFKKFPEMNAVLLATNYLAMHGLEALTALHKKIPDDMAVISFDDNTYFSLFSPSITAVAQPLQEISDEVIKLLMKTMNEKTKPAKKETIVLPVKLNIRNSSQPKK
jgi:LacI family transcriptional regulator